MIETSIGLQGFFQLVVRNADGTVARDTGMFPNLITDSGLNKHLAGCLAYAMVGKGNNAPSITDTNLTDPYYTSNARVVMPYVDSGALSVPPYYSWQTVRHQFDEGAVVGPVTEVGIFDRNGVMWSHALVLDENGNPTSVMVNEFQVLEVIYQVRLYPKLTDTPFTVTIGGVEHTGIIRASMVGPENAQSTQGGGWTCAALWDSTYAPGGAEVTPSDGVLGPLTLRPTGTRYFWGAIQSSVLYLQGQFATLGIVEIPLNGGNVPGGIKCMTYRNFNGSHGSWQLSFNPPIMKTATKILSFGMKISWQRYTP